VAATRDDLHQLINELPQDAPMDLLERLLVAVRDGQPIEPIDLVLLLAPVDDEPLTDEDRAAITQAEADEAAGRVHSHAEVWKRLAPWKRARRHASRLHGQRAAAAKRASGRSQK
jgi:hypothetical protein